MIGSILAQKPRIIQLQSQFSSSCHAGNNYRVSIPFSTGSYSLGNLVCQSFASNGRVYPKMQGGRSWYSLFPFSVPFFFFCHFFFCHFLFLFGGGEKEEVSEQVAKGGVSVFIENGTEGSSEENVVRILGGQQLHNHCHMLSGRTDGCDIPPLQEINQPCAPCPLNKHASPLLGTLCPDPRLLFRASGPSLRTKSPCSGPRWSQNQNTRPLLTGPCPPPLSLSLF